VQSEQPVELTLSFSEVPARILVNGTPLRSWHYDAADKLLTFKIPSGRQDILIHKEDLTKGALLSKN
jgi:hypothetical protein